MTRPRNDGRLLPAVMAALVLCWAGLGWRDFASATEAGFDTDASHTVTRVLAGSPAEAAKLRRGDMITHIDGIPVADAGSIAGLPRLHAGEVRQYTIRRAGETSTLPVRFGPLLPHTLKRYRVSSLTGLVFLLVPLLTWYFRPSEASRGLAVMGVGLSFAFIRAPYVADPGVRAGTMAVTSLFVLVGVAALVQFLLVFPQQRPWLRRRPRAWCLSDGRAALYLPAMLLWGVLAYRLVFTPPATGALNTVTSLAAGVTVGGYFMAALFLVLRNYSRTDRALRRALALNGMLWGTVAGIIPATIARLVQVFSPAVQLPGQDYYFVSLALIALTWSRSAARRPPTAVSASV